MYDGGGNLIPALARNPGRYHTTMTVNWEVSHHYDSQLGGITPLWQSISEILYL